MKYLMVAIVFMFCTLVVWGAEQGDAAKLTYTIKHAEVVPKLKGDWDGPAWKNAPVLTVSHFSKLGSGHKPKTQAKVVYTEQGLYVHFRVEDRYVRSIATEYRGKVWEDACVEFFVQPRLGRGYFNFEINCGGTMLLSYHEDKQWKGKPLRAGGGVPIELANRVIIWHSMPNIVEPEQKEPTTWQVEYFIPYTLLEAYLGSLGDVGGQVWRANFYKCAENNSHPHWGSWALMPEGSDFHSPQYFSDIKFEK